MTLARSEMPRMTIEEEIANLEARCERLRGRAVTVATAESATGGGIVQRLVSIAGASEYVLGGVVSYSNQAKQELLGVRSQTLAEYGAVSHEVAIQMAEGGRKALGADICVADTGIAGPGGGSDDKPVGLFYIAIATPSHSRAVRIVFDGDRNGNRRAAEEMALNLVRDYLLQCIDS
jgi:PncC family amidohydrolase